jgi:serine/threonine-protein kinase
VFNACAINCSLLFIISEKDGAKHCRWKKGEATGHNECTPVPMQQVFSRCPFMITTACHYCGLTILVPESMAGREGRCLNCGEAIRVPRTAQQPHQSHTEFAAGDVVNERYRIQKFIGKGGMGVVYLADDTLVKESVALKFLRPDLLQTARAKRLFLQEAQIARRLRHEHIIAVHDISATAAGILFFTMEFAEGKAIRTLLMEQRQQRKYLPVRLVHTIALQVLSALSYAHRLVVHRDIKPENIQLLPNERIKVLDFGLAIAVEEEETLLTASRSKSKIMGTLAYAAPEQLFHTPVDARTDLYALGLVLRELLSLKTPIELPPEEPLVRDDVPPDYLSVINKAVRKDKNDRWQSAAEFSNALQASFDQSFFIVTSEHVPAASSAVPTREGMVLLEGGRFLMGSNLVPECAPEREVEVAPFWMDIYPVTVKEYARFIEETGAEKPAFWSNPQFNGDDQPVVGATWEEARAFARWAGKELPTEAQWEFAARGTENRKYPWGSLRPEPSRCNFNRYLGMPSIVSMHEEGRTPQGIFDLAGNVYEWTRDPWRPYCARPDSAEAAEVRPRKAIRGGCYESAAAEMTTSWRKGEFHNVRLATLGFRCVIPL